MKKILLALFILFMFLNASLCTTDSDSVKIQGEVFDASGMDFDDDTELVEENEGEEEADEDGDYDKVDQDFENDEDHEDVDYEDEDFDDEE